MKPKSKGSVQHERQYAKGGGSNRMFGKQAAGPDRPGNTGKDQTAAPGAKRASGGPKLSRHAVATPARAGHTAPPRKDR
jgi:hypothetical protein